MTLTGTRMLLGLVAWPALALSAAVLGFGLIDPVLPGVQLAGDRALKMAIAAPMAIAAAGGVYGAFRLGPGKWLAWSAGLLLHIAAVTGMTVGSVAAVTADRPEGMLALSGVVVGGLALVPLAGIVALLRAIPVLRRPSYPSSALEEERR